MKYFYFRLIAPGYKVIGQDEDGKDITWRTLIFSDVKKVRAKNYEDRY